MPQLTPYQTVGPFFAPLLFVGGDVVATAGGPARLTLEIVVSDGAGQPVPDAMIECWQADARGHYAHPADAGSPRVDASFHGFGRAGTDGDGRVRFSTVKPGAFADRIGIHAPHIALGIFARGLLTRLVTRVYFEDEPSNDADPVLAFVEPRRRALLISRLTDPGCYHFALVLQGERETPFFDV